MPSMQMIARAAVWPESESFYGALTSGRSLNGRPSGFSALRAPCGRARASVARLTLTGFGQRSHILVRGVALTCANIDCHFRAKVPH